MRVILSVFLFLITLNTYSQEEASHWYFGQNAGLNFSGSGDPIVLLDGALNTDEGCTSISDLNGDLLFYTDGGWKTWFGAARAWVANGFKGSIFKGGGSGIYKYGISFPDGGGTGQGDLTGTYQAFGQSGLDVWNGTQEWDNYYFSENGVGLEHAV